MRNPCEKHLNVKADDYCPICLLERAETAEAKLKEALYFPICENCIQNKIDDQICDHTGFDKRSIYQCEYLTAEERK